MRASTCYPSGIAGAETCGVATLLVEATFLLLPQPATASAVVAITSMSNRRAISRRL